ncbi:MAG: hypothetical protein ACEPO8_06495 [Rhodothermaceae bacterium]
MKQLNILILLLLINISFAQSLLDELTSGNQQSPSYELNGYIRSGIYAGKNPLNNKIHSKSAYAEAALKIKVTKFDFGNAFADIRFNKSLLNKNSEIDINLNEAYVNVYLDNFDFRIGEQIVVWGKADGYNPTNNITPMNIFLFSPEEDDRRKGNFLLRGFYNFDLFRIEAIWIPVFESSYFPLENLSLPDKITMKSPDHPSHDFSQSSVAVRLHYEHPDIDGSISYFNGFLPQSGIKVNHLPDNKAEIFLSPYRSHVLGFDFSTTVGNYGLRGEFSYTIPFDDKTLTESTPGKQLEYIVGVDFERGDWSFIFQYLGKYVNDFNKPIFFSYEFSNLINNYVLNMNRLILSTTDEISHSVSFRPSVKLLNETLSIELLGQAKLTSSELFLKPKIIYDITDDLEVTCGAQLFFGDDNTLYDKISKTSSALFLEVKASF